MPKTSTTHYMLIKINPDKLDPTGLKTVATKLKKALKHTIVESITFHVNKSFLIKDIENDI